MASPYNNQEEENWKKITEKLIEEHPLSKKQIVDAVLTSWKQIFQSKIGPLSIGKQIFPTPQIMSNIIHELIPYNLAENVGSDYRVGITKTEKDIVYEPNATYSVEVKASSSKNDIYANRSYAQPSLDSDTKDKNGFYIGVNFEKFQILEDGEYRKVEFDNEGNIIYPKITQIKFGYLEHTDWIPQASAKGQQARLTKESKKFKLITLHP
ncbi:ScaI family restriction endonuclease [Tenacibaculum sp. UWU-22]|uniref:ScaI family restriction endonuclease n=1 Tax=Tenacibaculum sp. UWU-22 TaxID=3234187 RepID=UPI0034DAC22C